MASLWVATWQRIYIFRYLIRKRIYCVVSKNISHYSNHVKSQYFLPSSKFSKLILLPTYIPGSGSSDYTPDRPIGYGAFGVVWSVTDPRDGKRVALKKLPNVFQSLVSSKRVFRELKMMRFFKHDNVLSCLDILQVYLSRWSLPYMKKRRHYTVL